MDTTLNVPLVLASTSPRRIQLAQQARLPISVVAPNVDERQKKGESPRALVARLAHSKAQAVAGGVLREQSAAIVMAADTIVVDPEGKKVLGKPKNEAEARSMLKRLGGRTHTVLTGYCILSVGRGEPTRKIVRVVMSRVTMRKLSSELIRQYVATGEPMDKAGAYGAQGLGMILIEKINGSYTNVIGLPMAQLLEDLEKRFGILSGLSS
jgi:septum formation protein